jgi:acid phosphatase
VPQTHEHIGDKLSKKGVDWAWYAGAWQATLDEFKDSKGIPKIPNFQYHHQPFNYFKNLGRKTPPSATSACAMAAWATSRAPTASWPTSKRALPPVTFYKPQGNLNLHAGYADVASGTATSPTSSRACRPARSGRTWWW